MSNKHAAIRWKRLQPSRILAQTSVFKSARVLEMSSAMTQHWLKSLIFLTNLQSNGRQPSSKSVKQASWKRTGLSATSLTLFRQTARQVIRVFRHPHKWSLQSRCSQSLYANKSMSSLLFRRCRGLSLYLDRTFWVLSKREINLQVATSQFRRIKRVKRLTLKLLSLSRTLLAQRPRTQLRRWTETMTIVR